MSDDKPEDLDEILESIRNAVTFGKAAPGEDKPADAPPVEADELVMVDAIVDDPDTEAAADVIPQAPPAAAAVAALPRDTTLEALVSAALEPVLKTWLDANLPEIVERVTMAEIKRMTAG